MGPSSPFLRSPATPVRSISIPEDEPHFAVRFGCSEVRSSTRLPLASYWRLSVTVLPAPSALPGPPRTLDMDAVTAGVFDMDFFAADGVGHPLGILLHFLADVTSPVTTACFCVTTSCSLERDLDVPVPHVQVRLGGGAVDGPLGDVDFLALHRHVDRLLLLAHVLDDAGAARLGLADARLELLLDDRNGDVLALAIVLRRGPTSRSVP